MDMLKKTLLSLILMNIFVLTVYYGTDMLNVCGTNVRLIASVLTVFEDRVLGFILMIRLEHLSQGRRYRLDTKFVKKLEEHFSFFSKQNSFLWINGIVLCLLYGFHAA